MEAKEATRRNKIMLHDIELTWDMSICMAYLGDRSEDRET